MYSVPIPTSNRLLFLNFPHRWMTGYKIFTYTKSRYCKVNFSKQYIFKLINRLNLIIYILFKELNYT